jgi:hypothetical protein
LLFFVPSRLSGKCLHGKTIQYSKPALMKTILFSFALLPLVAFSQNISVDMIYSLPTGDIAPKEFYPAQFHSAFATVDYEQLMQISAKHVTRQLAAGKPVRNYPSMEIGTRFYSSMSISDCKNIPPAFFKVLPGKLITFSSTGNTFSWKSGTAESSQITILPDYRFVTGYDSVEVPSRNGRTFDVKLQAVYFHPENAALLFFESWNFNPSNGVFTKNIHQCGYEEKVDRFGDSFYKWTMVVDDHDSAGIKKDDKILMKNIITDISISYSETKINYDSTYKNMTGADAVNEMENLTGNLPGEERSQFEAALLNYAYTHPGKVFPVSADGIIDSLHPLTSEKFNSYFEKIDTVSLEDPANPGQMFPAWVKTETRLTDIYGFRFYEDWYYDPVEMIIKKKVKGIGLLMIIRDPQTGDASIHDAGLYIKTN